MSLLRLQHVSKHFGSLVAVDDASFEVEDGEFVTILGPSGSGKSTILRMIAGFESPTEGEIYIKDDNVVGVPPFERDVNMVFQNLALFPHLSVAGNIAYGLKEQGVPKPEREDRIEAMLEMVRLEGYGDRNPTQLSGGEQQRVALARALVNEPEIVLFDEPLASLDRKLRQHMQVELQRIQSETDITFLYVTHDQEVAMAVSDRLILLRDAEVEQIGTAEELYEEPVSQFVADFIGDVNTVSATVTDTSDERLVLETDDGAIALDPAAVRSDGTGEWHRGDDVAICIRPHEIELSEDDLDEPFSVRGRVQNRIYMGDQVSYIVDTPLGMLTVNTESEGFDIGHRVYATSDAGGIHLFRGVGESAASAATSGGP